MKEMSSCLFKKWDPGGKATYPWAINWNEMTAQREIASLQAYWSKYQWSQDKLENGDGKVVWVSNLHSEAQNMKEQWEVGR